MSRIEITRAGTDDFDAVDEAVEAAYAYDYGPRKRSPDPEQSSSYRAQGFDVWIARDAATGALLGSVTTRRPGGGAIHEDIHAGELDFRLLATVWNARRRGVGKALVEHVIRIAEAHGYEAVFLKSGPEMFGAHRLYEHLGFVRDESRRGLIRDGVRVRDDLHAFVLGLTPRTDMTRSHI